MTKRSESSKPKTGGIPASSATMVLVPKAWLVALAALIIAPWLIAAWIHFRERARPPSDEPTRAHGMDREYSSIRRGVGPWGQLELTTIVISPPIEYIPEDRQTPPLYATWIFPGMSREDLARFLDDTGVAAEARARIVEAAREDARISGVVASVSQTIIESLSPQTRAGIYARLAASDMNPRHVNAFRYYGESAQEWLGSAPIASATSDMVRRLAYRDVDFVLFADIDLVRAKISDKQEIRRLTKALFRESTLRIELHIPASANLDAIVEYWGRGGRMTDVRPLLESVATQTPERSIDVVHLLPMVARRRLYRYPQVSLADFDKPALVNCYWTALNFFNLPPDDRFLRFEYVMNALKNDYYLVHDRFQLGDVVMFVDENDRYYHAASYIADGVIFGKNGNSTLAPWTLLPIERIRGYYPQYERGRIEYYRRKDQ